MNIHFGYWLPGISFFDREGMLEQMNVEVMRRCRLSQIRDPIVMDLGCGVGSTLRTVRRHFPTSEVIGITLVGRQAVVASRWGSRNRPSGPRVLVGDYLRAPIRDASVDAAFCLESACYAPNVTKMSLLREMARVTMSGGRIVVADAMLKQWPIRSPVTRAAHRDLCDAWAVDTLAHLDSFLDTADDLGFRDIVVEDISVNVFPSVLHVPYVAARFLSRAYVNSTRLSPDRIRNAFAGVPLSLLALDSSAVGYFIISAERR